MSLDLSINEIKPLLSRALIHYEKRLREMQTDQDVLKLGIDLVKNDLATNAKEAESTLQQLDIVLKESVIPIEDRKILCLALTCYIDDLKLTIETTRTKMDKLNIPFKEIEVEITNADNIRNKICPNDWHWVSA